MIPPPDAFPPSEENEEISSDTFSFLLPDPGAENRLFVYGTLMQDRHIQMLLGRLVETQSGILHNYIRIAPSWSFPFVVPQAKTKTHGRVLFDLTEEEMKILDQFEDEGNLYVRQRVQVDMESGKRISCYTYVGRVDRLQVAFGKEVEFSDRFSSFLERKISKLLEEMPTDRPDIHKRVLQELMGSAVDSIIESVFEGDYLCNYIMIQTLKQSSPPRLADLLQNEALRPYAGNYMFFACQHIVLNQFIERFRAQSPESAKNDAQYLRHGLSLLMALIYYNSKKVRIDTLLNAHNIREIDGTRGYRDYATLAIDIADEMYNELDAEKVIAEVDESWYHAPTPLGAELEFSMVGSRAVFAQPGEDSLYDGFYWFNDFDLIRRTWRLGGHVDAHQQVVDAKSRSRGFLEYALGRYQIVGDLSRPIFVCPWALSRIINELVKFQSVTPHSLHISMEIPHEVATDQPHQEDDLACLLLLAGDLRLDDTGKLREWRIWNRELCLDDHSNSINFYSRKIHYSRHDQEHACEVMEFKFLRLFRAETDYEAIITGLKGYLFATNARPITAKDPEYADIPEQAFLREWAENPSPVDDLVIENFINTVRSGLLMELRSVRLDAVIKEVLSRVARRLRDRNQFVRNYAPAK